MEQLTHLVRLSPSSQISPYRRIEDVDYVPFPEHGIWNHWTVIRRHMQLIISLFILAPLVTAIAVFLAVPYYSATSTILVERQGPQVPYANKSVDEPAEGDADRFYKAQREILESRS